MFSDLKIGILGGGQLGAMLLRQATDFGLDVAVMDSDPETPCTRYTSKFTLGNTENYDDVMAFGKGLDVITIEKEAVNVMALKELEKQGVKVYPSPETINIIQNKWLQKQFLATNDIPVAKAVPILNREDLRKHMDLLPGILKICTSGYDGYGVMKIKNEADIAQAFDADSILEELVDIAHEIAVIVCRDEAGSIVCYDPVLMVFDQERFILNYQLSPAGIEEQVKEEACAIATKIAGLLELKGILAVEMFITKNGKLLVNEMAPRPHNSGHHTIEAAVTSQYEQLLRIAIEMPLGDTALHHSSVMLNILAPNDEGYKQEVLKEIMAMKEVHLHWYGKRKSRKGRKMGHITVKGKTITEAMEKAELVKKILN